MTLIAFTLKVQLWGVDPGLTHTSHQHLSRFVLNQEPIQSFFVHLVDDDFKDKFSDYLDWFDDVETAESDL